MDQTEIFSQSQPKALLSWKAEKFEDLDRHPYWHVVIFVSLLSLLAYSLFTDNYLLGIIVIISGLLIYLFEKMTPRTFHFGIVPDGIFAQDQFYKFSSLKSFWIFYEPEKQGRKELSLEKKGSFLTHAHIPLGGINPAEVRKLLVKFVPEEEHEETLIDSLEKFF